MARSAYAAEELGRAPAVPLNGLLGERSAATVGARNCPQHSQQNESLRFANPIECCSRHRAKRLRLLRDLVLFDDSLQPGDLHFVLFDDSFRARDVL